MGRPLRSLDLIPGGTYHVMSRGNRKAVIFEDDRARNRFRDILTIELEAHSVELLIHCEMDTHYHMTVTTPFANLSDFMEQLNGQFARFSNWRYKRVGHLFQGPFRHLVIESDVHLFTTIAYVFRNPVKARLVKKLAHYQWSSYAATAGLASCPRHLSIEWLKSLFPASTLEESQRRFRDIMDDPHPVAAYLQTIEDTISGETTRRSSRSYISEQRRKARDRLASRPALEELMACNANDRARFIYEARVIHGYTTRVIGGVLHLHPAYVSKIFRQFLRSRRRTR